jgi:intracellular septation protein A
VFGLLGLTLVFAFAQTPLMRRHHLATEAASGDETAQSGEG